MSSHKTEKPTPKKLRDSRRKGDVAHSKDVTQTMLMSALLLYMLGNAGQLLESFGRLMLVPATLVSLEFHTALPIALKSLLWEAGAITLPFVVIVLGVGMLSEFLQVGFVLSFEKIKPSGAKLNALMNLKNIFSANSVAELLKSLLKISFFVALLILVMRDTLPELVFVAHGGMSSLLAAMGNIFRTLAVNVVAAYAVISLADFAWQRWRHRQKLMMSVQELKQEFKEMEGSPHIKGKRRQLRHELATSNAVANARKASVVIVNPTHLAVAILYEPQGLPLPLVLAKGQGTLAARMVMAAREAGVPVMQNIPLARALMADAEADEYIPSELIRPVAEVLRLVRKLAGPDHDS